MRATRGLCERGLVALLHSECPWVDETTWKRLRPRICCLMRCAFGPECVDDFRHTLLGPVAACFQVPKTPVLVDLDGSHGQRAVEGVIVRVDHAKAKASVTVPDGRVLRSFVFTLPSTAVAGDGAVLLGSFVAHAANDNNYGGGHVCDCPVGPDLFGHATRLECLGETRALSDRQLEHSQDAVIMSLTGLPARPTANRQAKAAMPTADTIRMTAVGVVPVAVPYVGPAVRNSRLLAKARKQQDAVIMTALPGLRAAPTPMAAVPLVAAPTGAVPQFEVVVQSESVAPWTGARLVSVTPSHANGSVAIQRPNPTAAVEHVSTALTPSISSSNQPLKPPVPNMVERGLVRGLVRGQPVNWTAVNGRALAVPVNGTTRQLQPPSTSSTAGPQTLMQVASKADSRSNAAPAVDTKVDTKVFTPNASVGQDASPGNLRDVSNPTLNTRSRMNEWESAVGYDEGEAIPTQDVYSSSFPESYAELNANGKPSQSTTGTDYGSPARPQQTIYHASRRATPTVIPVQPPTLVSPKPIQNAQTANGVIENGPVTTSRSRALPNGSLIKSVVPSPNTQPPQSIFERPPSAASIMLPGSTVRQADVVATVTPNEPVEPVEPVERTAVPSLYSHVPTANRGSQAKLWPTQKPAVPSTAVTSATTIRPGANRSATVASDVAPPAVTGSTTRATRTPGSNRGDRVRPTARIATDARSEAPTSEAPNRVTDGGPEPGRSKTGWVSSAGLITSAMSSSPAGQIASAGQVDHDMIMRTLKPCVEQLTSDLKSAIAQKDKEIKEMKTELARKDAEIRKLEEDIRSTHQTALLQCKNDLKATESKLEETKKELQSASDQLKGLQSKLESHATSTAAEKAQQCAAVQETRKKLAQQVESLENALKHIRDLSQETGCPVVVSKGPSRPPPPPPPRPPKTAAPASATTTSAQAKGSKQVPSLIYGPDGKTIVSGAVAKQAAEFDKKLQGKDNEAQQVGGRDQPYIVYRKPSKPALRPSLRTAGYAVAYPNPISTPPAWVEPPSESQRHGGALSPIPYPVRIPSSYQNYTYQ